ncbi:ArsR/SmtB family transcription factor [Gluconacetobacter sp. Hr-1-5]|uniref:ArsR/SmtB family transcription factor n=1 Tax=Gluconacetobacter sp. Hr-1-5 TaxID=3395370 RepID=UPI003B525A60
MPQPLLLFQALADPTRLRILALLRAMELSIGEIAQVLGQSQPRVSRHVKILVNAGLAGRRKEGSWVFLTLGPPAIVTPVLQTIDNWCPKGDDEQQADLARLKAVRAVRAVAAEDYFETHAANWDALRSLHVAERDVEAAIERLLAPEPIGRMVDIGTGTGRMMELLGQQAESAIGFDRSPAMLRLARTKLAQTGPGNAELRQGDIYALPLPDGAADFAIMHQVLHYAQHPAAAIDEAARILAPGGRLLIVDFAPHDREDLRERDAHVRLGFTDHQMAEWFAAASLSSAPPVHLDGELTVKLWLGRRMATPAA